MFAILLTRKAVQLSWAALANTTHLRFSNRTRLPAAIPSQAFPARALWKVFGDAADSLADSLDPNLARDEVLARTGCLVPVRNISFDVHEGETFVIMGLSGSGKSTDVRCLSRLIEPTRGIIRIDGQDLLAMSRQQLMRKAMVFITHDFLEAFKVVDRVALMKDGEFVQVGTPEDLVASPVNDYARDFTLDVPRSKVLASRSVMVPPQACVSPGETVSDFRKKLATLDCRTAVVVTNRAVTWE